jgi:hypothetical protein
MFTERLGVTEEDEEDEEDEEEDGVGKGTALGEKSKVRFAFKGLLSNGKRERERRKSLLLSYFPHSERGVAWRYARN